jgi:hypothetical protein
MRRSCLALSLVAVFGAYIILAHGVMNIVICFDSFSFRFGAQHWTLLYPASFGRCWHFLSQAHLRNSDIIVGQRCEVLLFLQETHMIFPLLRYSWISLVNLGAVWVQFK